MLSNHNFSSFGSIAPLYRQKSSLALRNQISYNTQQVSMSLPFQKLRKSSSQSQFLKTMRNQSIPQKFRQTQARNTFANMPNKQKDKSIFESQQNRNKNNIATCEQYVNQYNKQNKKTVRNYYQQQPCIDFVCQNNSFDDKQNKAQLINLNDTYKTINQKQRLEPQIVSRVGRSSISNQVFLQQSFQTPDQQIGSQIMEQLIQHDSEIFDQGQRKLNRMSKVGNKKKQQQYYSGCQQIAAFYKRNLISIKHEYEGLIERICCQNDKKQRQMELQLKARARQSAQLQYQLECQKQAIEYFQKELSRTKRASSCSNFQRVATQQLKKQTRMISWNQHKQQISKISKLYRGQLEEVKGFYRKQVKQLQQKIRKQSQSVLQNVKNQYKKGSGCQIKIILEQIISETIQKITNFENRVMKNFKQEEKKLNGIKERIKQLSQPWSRKSVSIGNLDITPSFNQCQKHQNSLNSQSFMNKNSKEESLLIDMGNRQSSMCSRQERSVQTENMNDYFNQKFSMNEMSQVCKNDQNLLDSFKPSIIQFDNTPKHVRTIHNISDIDSLIYSQALSLYEHKQANKIDQQDFLSQITRVMGGSEIKIRGRMN